MTPRFIIDTNLGHLTRKLRMLGYDALFVNPIDDARLLRIAREEDRVIVSSDRGIFDRALFKSGKVKGLWIDVHQDHLAQLREIIRHFRLTEPQPFIRCIACNSLLVSKTKEEAEGKVPPRVYASVSRFDYCPGCDRFYWHGDHVRRMREVIGRL